jgi:predicted Zn-dependent peptidase
VRKKGFGPAKGAAFRKDILPNGIRVITETHPQNRAASCGIWVSKGTRDEAKDEAGLAHFVEHLVFKRTKKRNAYQISRDMEAVGGELNAFTSREYTSFVTHSLKEDVELSLDVLSDLVLSPTFDAADIKKEKQVVLQEIHMAEDMLEDNIFDHYFEKSLPKDPLGLPILGNVKSISGMKREKVIAFHERQYGPENILVSVTGAIDHDEVVKLADKHLKFKKKAPKNAPRGLLAAPRQPRLSGFRDVVRRPSEQAHILLGLPSHDFRHPLRYEGVIVNTLLGGGMTSKLYQTVREDRGLVYTIYSQNVTYVDMGLNLVYAGTEPKKMPLVIELILKEIKKLQKKGVSRSDLDLFKTQVRGQILLGADDIESRLNSIAINEMVFGQSRSVDEVIRDIEKISLDTIHEYIEEFFNPAKIADQMGILVMGAVPESATMSWLKTL